MCRFTALDSIRNVTQKCFKTKICSLHSLVRMLPISGLHESNTTIKTITQYGFDVIKLLIPFVILISDETTAKTTISEKKTEAKDDSKAFSIKSLCQGKLCHFMIFNSTKMGLKRFVKIK